MLVALALLYCHASHVLTLAVENNGGVGAALVDGQGGGNAPAFIVVGVVKKVLCFVAAVELALHRHFYNLPGSGTSEA